MKRFDLTFKGDILPDYPPEKVREGIALLFGISDPLVLDELFSGDSFVLRSNLDRKAAAEYFRRISQVGGRAELVRSKVNGSERAVEITKSVTDAYTDDEHVAATTTEAPPENDAKQVLQRLQQLKQEAQHEHQDTLEELDRQHDHVRQEVDTALQAIQLRREQVMVESQRETVRLQELEHHTRATFAKREAELADRRTALVAQMQADIDQLSAEHEASCGPLTQSIAALHDQREQYQAEADHRIAELEAQIASIREHCARQLHSNEQACGVAEDRLAGLEKSFSGKSAALRHSHDGLIQSLEAKKGEQIRDYEGELADIQRRKAELERQREEQLTTLWEDEEKSEHKSQERLKEIETHRDREQQSLEKKLERLEREESTLRATER